jgi:GAF domain-containing protein
MGIGAADGEAVPDHTEDRLAAFTELVATAITNTDARAEVARLAEEQAALRRVATLVAREASQADVFTAIAEEIGRLLGADHVRMVRFEGEGAVVVGSSGAIEDPLHGARVSLEGDNAMSRVFRTRRAARIDQYGTASGAIAQSTRAMGIRGVVVTPILVEGRLWGAMGAGTAGEEPLPPETEPRLEQFTELMAAAIANTESRARAERLADEQAALRRMATLVAKGAPPAELFAKVLEELANVLGEVECLLVHDEGDGTASVAASRGAGFEAGFPVGTRLPIDGDGITASVLRTGEPWRTKDYSAATGTMAARAHEHGIRSGVGCPIRLGGRIWGVLGVARADGAALPPQTETRITQFGDLVATAIANAAARAEVRTLADEQAALRRVATLVAEDVSPGELFAAVAREAGTLLGADFSGMLSYEDDTHVATVAAWAAAGPHPPVPARFPTEPGDPMAIIAQTCAPARVEDWAAVPGPIAQLVRSELGVRSSVGCPVVVQGSLWGALAVHSTQSASLPPDTEARLAQFADLVGTAIANADARAEVARLAEEQAALRRVATLVAEGASATAVFDAVAAEMQRLLKADQVGLSRYEPGSEITIVAYRGPFPSRLPIGTRWSHEGDNASAIVRRTERPVRIEHPEGARGTIAEFARASGATASVAAPIIVDGRLWGAITGSWSGDQSPPADTEERMAGFAQLLDTAIANADSRDQLRASRARVLTEADEARRRVVRDLHDGAQQRLVHSITALQLARRALAADDGEAESLVLEALEQAERGNLELRELAHGILPTALTRGGLQAGVDAVVARLDLPIRVDVPGRRFPPEVEASAYFIVAEALTNIVKHSRAGSAAVTASAADGMLHVEVRDDGIGGADPDGHGLVGMRDRATTLGGRLRVESAAGGGTLVAADIPVPS